MDFTPYQAKYFAYELTKRCPSDSVEKLASALGDAQVDLNPHQVEAALFAFRSPMARGAILADEVGLGKTIEARPAYRGDRREAPIEDNPGPALYHSLEACMMDPREDCPQITQKAQRRDKGERGSLNRRDVFLW